MNALEIAVTAGALWSPLLWGISMGITVYGLICALVHDRLVHQRFMRWVPGKGYAKRLVQARQLHPATAGRHDGVSFGFLFAANLAKLKAQLRRMVCIRIGRMAPEPALRESSLYSQTSFLPAALSNP